MGMHLPKLNRHTEQDEVQLSFASDLAEALKNQNVERGKWIYWSIICLIIVAIAWAYFAKLDEITRGQAKVIPSNQLQTIQNLEGGIVSEILVKEGQKVSKGDVLVRIDATRFNASFQENVQKKNALEAKIARLQAEVNGKDFVPKGDSEYWKQEQNFFEIRQRGLKESLSTLEYQVEQKQRELEEARTKLGQQQRSYGLILKELNITKPLAEKGVVSEVDLLRLQRDANDAAGEISGLKVAIPRLQAAVDEAKQKMEEQKVAFKQDAQKDLNDAIAQYRPLEEMQGALQDQVKRTTVRAPVDGIVQRILVNTVGGVVQPGMDIIEIVPTDENLLIEAKIRPSDIAYLHPGQMAQVRFTAYDFATYGGLKAELINISPDTVKDEEDRESYYIVRLRTLENHLGKGDEKLPIIPGMTATVDIKTGKKTVLDYLLKPVFRAKETALRER
ncbi:HlyD family type I secretion periplasmic adaptor subunit [Pokkaliibacter sp. CJK22405]|uniref:HlyD family type I secretion periplasmic adaptor subunit n=1 Tax=Pokkaliibacter sp. CJK22405 TaxID=3384615 RepID=UPI0039848065